jgi:hypothetical protein
MLRLAWVIILMAAVGAAAVHLRLRATQARTQIQSLEAQRVQMRRQIWEQQVKLGELTAPQETRFRGKDTALDSSPGPTPTGMTAERG